MVIVNHFPKLNTFNCFQSVSNKSYFLENSEHKKGVYPANELINQKYKSKRAHNISSSAGYTHFFITITPKNAQKKGGNDELIKHKNILVNKENTGFVRILVKF